MADQIIELFATVLGIDPVALTEETAPANTSAWDSIANISLITEIEEQFAIELSTSEIESMRSIGQVRAILQRRGVLGG